MPFSIANVLAFVAARSMTRYVSTPGHRTVSPETLSPGQKAEVILAGVHLPRPTNTRTPQAVGLDSKTITLPIQDGEARERLELWHIPRSVKIADALSPVVLMFPGYGGSKDDLLPPASAFHDFGCDVVLADYRGVGGSSGSHPTTLGVREASDIAAVFTWARSQFPNRRVLVYGASLGAAAALRAVAHEGVTPDALILESPFDRLLTTTRHRFSAMGLLPSPGAEMVVFWGGVQLGVNGFANNPVEYAAKVRCPTLLMHGRDDNRVLEAETRAIFDALPRHDDGSRCLILNGVGHSGLESTDSLAWRDAVQDFLAPHKSNQNR